MLSLLKIYTSDRTSNQRLCEPEYLYINTCIGDNSLIGVEYVVIVMDCIKLIYLMNLEF